MSIMSASSIDGTESWLNFFYVRLVLAAANKKVILKKKGGGGATEGASPSRVQINERLLKTREMCCNLSLETVQVKGKKKYRNREFQSFSAEEIKKTSCIMEVNKIGIRKCRKPCVVRKRE